MKLATIFIPCHNYARFLGQAIESVLTSDGYDKETIEIIVVDDGSTDATPSVAHSYGDKIRFIQQAQQGKAIATQVGIAAATGQFFFNLDADDCFLSEKIHLVSEILTHDLEIIHVFHPVKYWDMQQETTWEEVIPNFIQGQKIRGHDLMHIFYVQERFIGGGSTFVARLDALRNIPIVPEIGSYIDEYLVLSILQQNQFSFCYPAPLSLYRLHGQNTNRLAFTPSKICQELQGKQAIFQQIQQQKFPSQILALYGLKVKVFEIISQEMLGKKNWSSIWDLLKYIKHHWHFFKPNPIKILQKYWVIPRFLSIWLLHWIRKLRQHR